MTLSVHGFANTASAYKIVQKTGAGTTLVENSTGTSGKIYCITLTNTDQSNGAYVKFFLRAATDTPTVGTTEPDLHLRVQKGDTRRYDFPSGLDFNRLSFYASRNSQTSDTTAPGTTKVVILCT